VRERGVTPERVHAYVAKHPGMRCLDIALALDAPPVVVSAILRKLKLAGTIKRVGAKETRGTRWRVA
jgi:hypothetical protein